MEHVSGPIETTMIKGLSEKLDLEYDYVIYYAIRKLYEDNFGKGSSTDLLMKLLAENK